MSLQETATRSSSQFGTPLNSIPPQVTVPNTANTARVDEPDHSGDGSPENNDNNNTNNSNTSNSNTIYFFRSTPLYSSIDEDTRQRLPEKISQNIEVTIVTSANPSGTIESTASSQEILGALQASISAFKGPARIGVPNRENPSYTEFFSTIAGFEYQESDLHVNARLIIPPANAPLSLTLNLTIAAIGGAKIAEQPESPPDLVEELLGWAKTKSEALLNPPSTSVRSNRKRTIQLLTDAELSWIMGRVKHMPGFDMFESNQCKRLNNLARVNYWKFSAHFSAQYHKTQWPSGISLLGGNTIKKSAIEVALKMGTTALAHAINMTRILSIYYDGPQRSSEVVGRVEATGEMDSDALAKFLVQWEKDHPIFATT
ncbi:hypothetical protein C8J57DRAFT_1509474 [Mycena rebaudengoi]|nr:hypothetical protein C8J57DRAFT_1509474 [Mycena rebaudengoi]